MKSKNAALHAATVIFPYFYDVDSVVEQQKNPVANADTHTHTHTERARETYTEKHAVTHSSSVGGRF